MESVVRIVNIIDVERDMETEESQIEGIVMDMEKRKTMDVRVEEYPHLPSLHGWESVTLR